MEGREKNIDKVLRAVNRDPEGRVFYDGSWWIPRVNELSVVGGTDRINRTGIRVELNGVNPWQSKKTLHHVRDIPKPRSSELTPIRLADRKIEKMRFASLYLSDKGVCAYIDESNTVWEVRLDEKGYPQMSYDTKVKGVPIVTLTRTESGGENRITTAYWRNQSEFDRVFNDNR